MWSILLLTTYLWIISIRRNQHNAIRSIPVITITSCFLKLHNHYKMKKVIYSALAIVLISGTAAVAAISHSGKEKATCTCTKCSCPDAPSCVCTK